jgi:uncharacterized membrane protein YsdA (DUF1294 family)
VDLSSGLPPNRFFDRPLGGTQSMLEVIVLFVLCRRIGHAARRKRRRAIRYQLLLLLLWFGGEIGAAFELLIVAWLFNADFEDHLLTFYILALAGAVCGAWLAFRTVAKLPEPVVYDLSYDQEPPADQPLS